MPGVTGTLTPLERKLAAVLSRIAAERGTGSVTLHIRAGQVRSIETRLVEPVTELDAGASDPSS